MKKVAKEVRTQGSVKMEHYIDDLVRNKGFKELLKKGRLPSKLNTKGMYDSWTDEQKKEHDKISTEISFLLKGYETLRKRAKKTFGAKHFKNREILAEKFGLDLELIYLAEAKIAKDDASISSLAQRVVEPDMCRVFESQELIHGFDHSGDEIIHINPKRKLQMLAFPVSIGINARASKRDVLDFIEKRWDWIEKNFGLREAAETKVLKTRKRKYPQEMLDFLWDNRNFSAKELKKRLDTKFPNNGLVYFELSGILRYEATKRELT